MTATVNEPLSRPLRIVAAAALVDADGNVLVQRRPPGRPLADLWEFPGGKLDPGEAPEEALIRELDEELGIGIDAAWLAPAAFASLAQPGGHLLLLLYICRKWVGSPEPRHATELAWHRPAALHRLAMPPADRPLIALLEALI